MSPAGAQWHREKRRCACFGELVSARQDIPAKCNTWTESWRAKKRKPYGNWEERVFRVKEWWMESSDCASFVGQWLPGGRSGDFRAEDQWRLAHSRHIWAAWERRQLVRQSSHRAWSLAVSPLGIFTEPCRAVSTTPWAHYGNNTPFCLLLYLCSLKRGLYPSHSCASPAWIRHGEWLETGAGRCHRRYKVCPGVWNLTHSR